MYNLKQSNDVPGPKQLVRVGLPEHIEPDICITTDLNSHVYLSLNSTVLREALLKNKLLTIELLGLVVEDVKVFNERKAAVQAAKAKAKNASPKNQLSFVGDEEESPWI